MINRTASKLQKRQQHTGSFPKGTALMQHTGMMPPSTTATVTIGGHPQESNSSMRERSRLIS